MRRLALFPSALTLAGTAAIALVLTSTSAAVQDMGAPMTMRPPPQTSTVDSRLTNPSDMHPTPSTIYDSAAHERITYSLSRESGGFIEGVNTETHKAWHADVRPDRSMSGKDADGDAWKYDSRTKTYTNLATGKSCAKANLRHVCAM